MKIAEIDRFQNGRSKHVNELMICITCDDFVCCFFLSFFFILYSFLHDQTDSHTMQQLWLGWWHLFQCKSNIEEEIKRTQNPLQSSCNSDEDNEANGDRSSVMRIEVSYQHSLYTYKCIYLHCLCFWFWSEGFSFSSSNLDTANTIIMCEIFNQEDIIHKYACIQNIILSFRLYWTPN